MRGAKIIQILLWLVYPLLIYAGLRYFEPRGVAVLLAITLLLRRYSDARRFFSGLSRVDRGTLICLLALALLTAWINSETLLRLYPATVNLCMLMLFGHSLKTPPSMIERFARVREPDLPPAGVRYTRQITKIWCLFFISNGMISAWTALYASRDAWALYNGFIAYLLMGALFAGEWIVRRYYFPRPQA